MLVKKKSSLCFINPVRKIPKLFFSSLEHALKKAWRGFFRPWARPGVPSATCRSLECLTCNYQRFPTLKMSKQRFRILYFVKKPQCCVCVAVNYSVLRKYFLSFKNVISTLMTSQLWSQKLNRPKIICLYLFPKNFVPSSKKLKGLNRIFRGFPAAKTSLDELLAAVKLKCRQGGPQIAFVLTVPRQKCIS